MEIVKVTIVKWILVVPFDFERDYPGIKAFDVIDFV